MPEPLDPAVGPRLREFLGRARRAPGLIDDVAHDVAEHQTALDEVRAALAALEELAWAGRHDTQGGVTAVGEELRALAARLDRTDEAVAGLGAGITARLAALHRDVAAPRRDAGVRALLAAIGPEAPRRRPGLSVLVPCWNHADLLPEAVASALAALDLLPPGEQGEVVVLDDASVDATRRVAGELAAADRRVQVVASDVNVGLARARNVLAHRCTTTHALQLDADNLAAPDGVAALFEAAGRTGATLTYGTIVQVDAEGRTLGPISNEPVTPGLLRANYVDAMAVVDVAAAVGLGGWATDPHLEHIEDWTMVRRVMAAGRLLAFVPTVVGRYRVLASGLYRSESDPRPGIDRIGRLFDPTGRRLAGRDLTGVAAVAFHPATGPLWATPEAVALDPRLAPTAPPPVTVAEPARRVLVVAPGGVANLGDDAITVQALDRVRSTFGAGTAIDLVTDGAALPPGRGEARWLGTLLDLLAGLTPGQVGPVDGPLADAAAAARVGEGRWAPLQPDAYDAAVLVGGGSLHSLWSAGLVAPRALLAAALRTAGVPYALSGQGIGPVEGETDRTLVAGLLAGAVAVACRDEGSAELALGLPGGDAARVVVTGDDALGLVVDPAPRPDATNGVLAVTIRRAGYVGPEGADPARAWALAADAVAAARGWDVVGIALNDQPPEPEIATLAALRATTPLRARWRLVECGTDPRRLAAEVAAADAVAAQSYHAAVLALDAGVPAVLGAASPYYVGKARGLATLAGLPDDLAVADPERLGAALAAVEDAVAAGPRPLDAARGAVDRWWAGLPERLGVAVSG